MPSHRDTSRSVEETAGLLDGQHRSRALPGGGHAQPVKGLDDGEEREEGGAFGGHGAKGCPGPSHRKGEENQCGMERDQDEDGDSRGAGDACPIL